jgi:predicted permease
MRAGGPPAAVLSDELWHSRFGGATSVVGQSIILDGAPRTVVGVAGRKFPKWQHEQVYTPLVLDADIATSRGTRSLLVTGRVRDGLTIEAAARRMAEIGKRLSHDFPDDEGIVTRLQPIEEGALEDSAELLEVLLGAVGFVLLIACANIANLVLARGTGRVREMTVRAALGAGRWRLARQLLTENLLLAFAGGLAGVIPAWLGIHFIKSFEIESLPQASLISLNWNVVAFNFALAIATGLLFGMVPAWQARKLNMSDTLKAGNRSATAGTHKRLRGTLVVCQVALSMVLLAGAGLMVESFLRMRSAWPGYDSRQLLTMKIALADKQYSEKRAQASFYDRVLSRARGLPGVAKIGATDELPISDNIHGSGVYQPDRPTPRRADIPVALVNSITPDYFDTMRIPLRKGRWFSDADGEGSRLVAVVDEFAAHRLWPNENPLGKPIKLGTKEPVREVVGVVGSVDAPLLVTLLAGRLGQVYLPFAQVPKPGMSLVVRYEGQATPLISAMRDVVRQVDVDQPVFQIRTMDEVRGTDQLPQKLAAYLLTAFAAVALALAGIGIYGVMAYSVGQRTREFGIRMSLGAQPREVWGGVLRQGAVLGVCGIAIGLAGAFGLTRLMGKLLFRIGATDPLTFAGVTLLLAVVTLFAAWLPARRATRVDPVLALREE